MDKEQQQQQQSSSNTKSDKPMGLFFHQDMLLHKAIRDHPEKPERLTTLLQTFRDNGLYDKFKVYDDMQQMEIDDLISCHGESYVDFVEQLWEDQSTKEVRYFKDTYYNKHTTNAAKLAAGAVKLAIDELMTNKIAGGFATVRPPGHHAAGNSNRIQGFCIYNNVAAAAVYAKKKYNLKKIAIFDWDVHHGDSTSKIFYDDPDVLYMSIHRYDDGKFYPLGDFGGMDKLGSGKGEGFNLNFPWNVENKYHQIGDSEYIHVMENVFLPILKEFEPELLFISAGFDAGREDPLGGLDITPGGYAYMTKALIDAAPLNRTLLVLEGGYNLQTVATSAMACARVLLGEQLPLKESEVNRTFEQMKELRRPNKLSIETIKSAQAIYSKHWKCMNNTSAQLNTTTEESKQDQGNSKEEFLSTDEWIAGGHRENFMVKSQYIIKKTSQREIDIYEDINNPNSPLKEQNQILKPLIPEFLGTWEHQGEKRLLLKNIAYKYPTASILDIKLGAITYCYGANDKKIESHIKKAKETTSGELRFRIAGAILKNRIGEMVEKKHKKDIYYELNSNNVSDYFIKYFKSCSVDGNKVYKRAFDETLDVLEKLIDFLKNQSTRAWRCTSLLMIADEKRDFVAVKFIDLGSYVDCKDGEKDINTLEGLENIQKLLRNIEKEGKL